MPRPLVVVLLLLRRGDDAHEHDAADEHAVVGGDGADVVVAVSVQLVEGVVEIETLESTWNCSTLCRQCLD